MATANTPWPKVSIRALSGVGIGRVPRQHAAQVGSVETCGGQTAQRLRFVRAGCEKKRRAGAGDTEHRTFQKCSTVR
jgi:hypothetical protein